MFFLYQWLKEIKASLQTRENPSGTITNSDLEMAEILILWLVMEKVCPPLKEKHVALFSNNTPTVSWVSCLASKQSTVAGLLLHDLALRLKSTHTCPLMPLHIEGRVHNAMTNIPSRSIGSNPAWHCNTINDLLTQFSQKKSPPTTDLLVRLPSQLKNPYTSDFAAADEAYLTGQVAAKRMKSHWKHWCTYVQPLGMEPYLQGTPFGHRIRALTGFASRIHWGYHSKKCQVQVGTAVSSAITAIGNMIALASEHNPTKVLGPDKFHNKLQEVLDGCRRHDPQTTKKLPVESDVPEYIAALSLHD
jgi:hypothetical protein